MPDLRKKIIDLLPAVPDDGLAELYETMHEIIAFYEYVSKPSPEPPPVKPVKVRLNKTYIRPEFPIDPEDL